MIFWRSRRLICLWDTSDLSGTPGQENQGAPCLQMSVQDGGAVNGLAFSANSQYLAAADADGSVYLFEVDDQSLLHQFLVPGGDSVQSVALTTDGRVLAAGDYDGSSYIWYAVKGAIWTAPESARTATLTDPGAAGVNAVAFSPNNKILAAGDSDGTAYLWSMCWRGYCPL